jgi:hypothetical protein
VLLAQIRAAARECDLQGFLRNFQLVIPCPARSALYRRQRALSLVFDVAPRDSSQTPAELLGEDHVLTSDRIGDLSTPRGVGCPSEFVRSKHLLQACDVTSVPVAQHGPLPPSDASRAEHRALGALSRKSLLVGKNPAS